MEVESFLSAQLSMTRMMYFLITSSKYYTCITYLCHRSIVGLMIKLLLTKLWFWKARGAKKCCIGMWEGIRPSVNTTTASMFRCSTLPGSEVGDDGDKQPGISLANTSIDFAPIEIWIQSRHLYLERNIPPLESQSPDKYGRRSWSSWGQTWRKQIASWKS